MDTRTSDLAETGGPRRRDPALGAGLRRWRRRRGGFADPGSPWRDLGPIRSELFSAERLELHAGSLAHAQPVASRRQAGRGLSARLADNEAELLAAYRTTLKAAQAGAAIMPAAEWLLDNFHLVERQVREIRTDLPSGYYRELPKLVAGPLEGYPRVLGVAWAYVAHTDSLFDVDMLRRYLRAYQEVQPLNIGELWAVPITLRFLLIENLRRLAEGIEATEEARRGADRLADRLLGVGEQTAEPAHVVLAEHGGGPLHRAFVAQLLQRLRGEADCIGPALTWLDDCLATEGASAHLIVQHEQESQVAASATVRNVITSLRLIAEVDWMDVFEQVSPVDARLAEDGGFRDLDFATRNLYRGAIEDLARHSGRSELEITEAALQAARASRRTVDAFDARSDPGYHLLGAGRGAFETRFGYRAPLRAWPQRAGRALGLGGYGAGIVAVAAALLAAPILGLSGLGVSNAWLAALALLGALPALDAAVAFVNCAVTRSCAPSLLPGCELRDGVPAALRTLVAVPMLLTSEAAVADQVASLEIHYLSSPEGEVYFALLSDWTDAASEQVEGDEALLSAAAAGVAALNRKYGPGAAGERFMLLHRRRVWNAGERRWIGWERKRGKLHELNRLLRGAEDTTHVPVAGRAPAVPPGVCYVVTLDADTKLPRDTVRRLIGKMAHPLNRPRFDAACGRVVEGHGVLQPRVTPSLATSDSGTRFQRIFSGPGGIDPYAAAVSDVYQDLLGEGSYAGKGVYHVDAFEAALAGRAPESAVLSHDLFEGIFARAGLVSDVEVVEEYPARYDVAALRHHRWTRGDWQLLPWILGRGGAPAAGRWKMVDNLRRSLTAPAAVAALIAGWSLPLSAASAWTAFIAVLAAAPSLIPVIGQPPFHRAGAGPQGQVEAWIADLRLALARSGLMVVFLAHQAWLMGDAVVRTLWRLLISRRNLLQWTPAAQLTAGRRLDLAGFYRQMSGAVIIAAAAAAWSFERGAWPLGVLVSGLWLASPAMALWLSRPSPAARPEPLTAAGRQAFRKIARLTWRYFETQVTPADNMLPPDNVQESPAPAVARRTSPTNIGLYLLAVTCAREFGWIGTRDAVERLEATLATLARLPRFRGHFYNWYATADLRVLDPHYVSSVDSGNLAGHLIAVANACAAWRRTPGLAGSARRDGVADALALARDALDAARETLDGAPWRHLDEALRGLDADLQAAAGEGAAERFSEVAALADGLAGDAQGLSIERAQEPAGDLQAWLAAAREAALGHQRDLAGAADGAIAERLTAIEAAARAMALEMDFGFLLDPDRKLLSIGYRPAEGERDGNCYDLLASEARLASFVAIAKGDAQARHWFHLGHAVTALPKGAALISWSGSMFEYLMPELVMQTPAGSLLDRTNRSIVRRQIDYGAGLGTPWGVSESAFNARDLELTYQYSNFGVPGLGLKRGLGDNAVIAPYATALAAMIDPLAALRNFERLADIGAKGRYGFYEALDYTPSRVPDGERLAIVRAFMAHHQGMTIVALANVVLDGVARGRFHAEPMVQATELLLQERMPRAVAPPALWMAAGATQARLHEAAAAGRRIASPHGATPATQLLSNGDYTVMLTAAGGGYSSWRGQAITRWREDATCDDWGGFVYLRDARTGEAWSAAWQPTGAPPDAYDVALNEDRAEISRRDGSLTTVLDVLVSAEDDAEVRRVSITNNGDDAREIEITSYMELALAPAAADAAHPAFSKLFVQTEQLTGAGALVAHRRARAPDEPEIWAAHLAVLEGEGVGKLEFETDRARFLGRGRAPRAPAAVVEGRPLSGAVGTVLDPIFALRRRVRIAAGATVRVAFWTMAAASREAITDLIDKHHDVAAYDRAAALAWTQAQVQLRHLDLSHAEAGHFQRLAGHLIYAAPALRPTPEAIAAGAGPQSGLWPLGISGDLPIALLRISEGERLDVARDLLRAAEFWRLKGFAADVVILNEKSSSYVQDLQGALEDLVRTSRPSSPGRTAAGGVYIVRADLAPRETLALLMSVARVVLVAEHGSLVEQLDRAVEVAVAQGRRPRQRINRRLTPARPRPPRLEFFNGLGGFDQGGREYVVVLGPGQATPAPWINVIANPGFGFQVSSDGAGYAWSVNSRERQLTPWSNDPVTDGPGQAIYLRDEDSGEVWTPTASPIRDEAATYVARHGFGYSRFELTARELEVSLVDFASLADPVKVSRLRIRNASSRRRRLTVTAYAEWVLGPSRGRAAPHVVTDLDPTTGALFARNRWTADFAARVAFLDLGGRQAAWTGDRREFLGRNGTLAHPAALASGTPLSGRLGGGLDPCGAVQGLVELAPGESREIVVLLGDAEGEAEARALVERYRAADLDATLGAVGEYWADLLGTVQVETPDRALDVMANGWLLYQTLACRIWARAAFYQAGGAYGFRDQLQDVLALAPARPELAREHLLRAAARQFPQGDVQHWWLPHSGQGVRTRISDDRLWLAHCTAHYVQVSGDAAVLDAPVPFLDGPELPADETESFFQPQVRDEAASLYEHCARALDASLQTGAHGLPLIGGGDWNDGMNRVGAAGRGESVWLGWFLHAALTAFAPFAQARGDQARVESWRRAAGALAAALDREAWDGDWYRRAWFDDGTPLGSAANGECRIDSIAQSWAVISGAGDPARASRAMAAVERELILPETGLALLFAPPFDQTDLDPGYIRGYPPGVRENGGQYTHAAIWSAIAFCRLGEGDRAVDLLSMLNPINHARSRGEAHLYKVEPYVVAADIYSQPPHVGRGGWTWYTGAAGWMHRAIVENVLGLAVVGGSLRIDPCIPKAWPGFKATLRRGTARYEIVVDNPEGVCRGVVGADCDGVAIAARPVEIPTPDDGRTHRVTLRLGAARAGPAAKARGR